MQLSTRAAFKPIFLDKTYGFGEDVRLEDDIEALEGKSGIYYIRWSLIDLLDLEHPFHKTKYFIYTAPDDRK